MAEPGNRTTRNVGEPPKGLDGLEAAKADVRRTLDRLENQIQVMHELLIEDNPAGLSKYSTVTAQDAAFLATKVGAWYALFNVKNGIYKDPRDGTD